MEIKLENQCNTLGSILREQLELECEEEFATCVVPEISSTYLLVTTPSTSVLRKSLLGCKEELKSLEKQLFKKNQKRKK
jgi:hypothetical protein